MSMMPLDGKPPAPVGPARGAYRAARAFVRGVKVVFFRRVLGMDIGDNVRIDRGARLDFTYPRGVHVGDGAAIAYGAIVFTHDLSRLLHTDTWIGRNCLIGAKAIVMPGVRIGDFCIVESGAVVTRDVPAGSIVAGNPAVIVRSGIRTGLHGRLDDDGSDGAGGNPTPPKAALAAR